MLERFFERPVVLTGLESPEFKAHLDTFADDLHGLAYSREYARNQLRAAAHFCVWAQARVSEPSKLNQGAVEAFWRHLPVCRCPGPSRGKSPPILRWVRRFVEHLECKGVVPKFEGASSRACPSLLRSFLAWMSRHRGVVEATLRTYERHLSQLLEALGDDPSGYTAGKLRDFVQRRSKDYSREGAKKVFSAVRMFLRYLVVEGRCPAGLEHALPRLASWSQQTLPRALPASDVERLIAACDPATKIGIRDRAILLLLARLALRAGDIAALRLQDLCWQQGTVRVQGKGRSEALLPLPQQVGDAILAYLESGRPACESDHLFVRCCAPFRPFASGVAVSLIVRRAFQRSGVESPCKGAHVLRHSAATEMLRQGTPMHGIAAVLRHQSIETTTLYAKVDVELLREIAQPWPEVLQC